MVADAGAILTSDGREMNSDEWIPRSVGLKMNSDALIARPDAENMACRRL